MPVFHQRIILGKSDHTRISIICVRKLTLLMKWLHCVKRGHYGCQLTTKIKLMLALLLLVADARYGHFVYNRMHQHSKLTPAGYQILTPQIKRSRSISPPATKKQVRQTKAYIISLCNNTKICYH